LLSNKSKYKINQQEIHSHLREKHRGRRDYQNQNKNTGKMKKTYQKSIRHHQNRRHRYSMNRKSRPMCHKRLSGIKE
jgi:hypothetical protein